MSTELNSAEPQPPPPKQDVTPEERHALFRDTLKSLQEAFSAPGNDEDADTTAELHQNAAEAAPDLSRDTP